MQWQDSGIIIGVIPFGESKQRIICLTQHNGLKTGLFRPSKNQHLFLGDRALFTWRGRLEEHLGTFQIEVEESIYSQFLYQTQKIILLRTLTDLLSKILPDSHTYPEIFKHLECFLYHQILDSSFLSYYVHFEVFLLNQLGFHLDFTTCALTGETENLTHVSPNTGRAVTTLAAKPYIEKLLELPEFLQKDRTTDNILEIEKGLMLTGHFLSNHLLAGQPLSENRTFFIDSLKKDCAA